jgi:hypothetical protein
VDFRWLSVSETEVQDEICQSDGCPTVSPQFLKQLTSDQPISKADIALDL